MRIVARADGPYGDWVLHSGTHLEGEVYLVHFNAEITQGPKQTLGREVDVELSPENARALARRLNAAADTAESYQRSRDHYTVAE